MEEVGHIYIPAYVMARQDINLIQKVLFGKIVGLCGKDGYCFASNEWLSKQLDKSPKTISKWIGDLVEIGLIRREVVRNEKAEIIKRKLFPMFVESGGGIPEIEHRGIPEIGQDIQENYIQELYIKTPSKKKTKGVSEEIRMEYSEWLSEYNRMYGSSYKGFGPLKNYAFWRESYSKGDLLLAIKNLPQDDWLRDKHNPTVVLRQFDTKGNPVDRIGSLISIKPRYNFI